MENGTKVLECKKCPAGHYAPKIIDMGHFEEMPELFTKVCTVSTNIGDPRECDVNKGWNINSFQRLDSNGASSGIPQGLKFGLRAYLSIQNKNGGRFLLTYKMRDFTKDEYFRVLVNGVLQYSSNQDTQSDDFGINLEPSNEQLDGFVYFESGLIPYGNNSIEISVISNIEEYRPDFVSKANVEIKRITFLGTTVGGASDCIPVPLGWYAPA